MNSTDDVFTCDYCYRPNFPGLRFKCLACHNYDLCSKCYFSGFTTSRHKTGHPIQCIVPRRDYDVYYTGEKLTLYNQSLTCPICGQLGFTKLTLIEHVESEHPDKETFMPTGCIVVCPICGAEANKQSQSFLAHIQREHKSSPRNQQATPLPRIARGGNSRLISRCGRIPMRTIGDSGESSIEDANLYDIPEVLQDYHHYQTDNSEYLEVVPTASLVSTGEPDICILKPNYRSRNSRSKFPTSEKLYTKAAHPTSENNYPFHNTRPTLEKVEQTIKSTSEKKNCNQDKNNAFLLPNFMKPKLTSKDKELREFFEAYRSFIVQELVLQMAQLKTN